MVELLGIHFNCKKKRVTDNLNLPWNPTQFFFKSTVKYRFPVWKGYRLELLETLARETFEKKRKQQIAYIETNAIILTQVRRSHGKEKSCVMGCL